MAAVESTEIGGAVGRIKADDPDVGRNAEMEYTIVGGHDTFNIITDQMTQEGVVIIKKVGPLFALKPYFLWLAIKLTLSKRFIKLEMDF